MGQRCSDQHQVRRDAKVNERNIALAFDPLLKPRPQVHNVFGMTARQVPESRRNPPGLPRSVPRPAVNNYVYRMPLRDEQRNRVG
jgi:hypothetical protein